MKIIGQCQGHRSKRKEHGTVIPLPPGSSESMSATVVSPFQSFRVCCCLPVGQAIQADTCGHGCGMWSLDVAVPPCMQTLHFYRLIVSG